MSPSSAIMKNILMTMALQDISHTRILVKRAPTYLELFTQARNKPLICFLISIVVQCKIACPEYIANHAECTKPDKYIQKGK